MRVLNQAKFNYVCHLMYIPTEDFPNATWQLTVTSTLH